MPDFKKINLDSIGEVTLPVILGFFAFLRGIMRWFETDGKALLEQPDPLTFEQWNELHTNSWLLLTRLERAKGAATKIHLQVLRKGISSLIHWEKNLSQDADNKYVLGQWQADIARDVCVGGPFGLGSHYCHKEDSWELVESMVPIAQTVKSEPLLRSIAMERYAGDDKLSVELFFKAHKNW